MDGRTVVERFPAGGPRGSWQAQEFARARRQEGLPAEVVTDLATDTFLVFVRSGDNGAGPAVRRGGRAPVRPSRTRRPHRPSGARRGRGRGTRGPGPWASEACAGAPPGGADARR
ncbi:hypothetical protein GCM10018787_09150 [Streptomyces thermodiastaticus]|nr:hypothetical protein GCM10018787_09150 [Streptomyces thermodiastaticus]